MVSLSSASSSSCNCRRSSVFVMKVSRKHVFAMLKARSIWSLLSSAAGGSTLLDCDCEDPDEDEHAQRLHSVTNFKAFRSFSRPRLLGCPSASHGGSPCTARKSAASDSDCGSSARPRKKRSSQEVRVQVVAGAGGLTLLSKASCAFRFILEHVVSHSRSLSPTAIFYCQTLLQNFARSFPRPDPLIS